MADGTAGFWAALTKIFPKIQQQCCVMHKTRNVPKCLHTQAKKDLNEIWGDPGRLLVFYNLPGKHWCSIRSTNVINRCPPPSACTTAKPAATTVPARRQDGLQARPAKLATVARLRVHHPSAGVRPVPGWRPAGGGDCAGGVSDHFSCLRSDHFNGLQMLVPGIHSGNWAFLNQLDCMCRAVLAAFRSFGATRACLPGQRT